MSNRLPLILCIVSFYIVPPNLNTLYAQNHNPVFINEIVASNLNGLVDTETGEYKDWVELYNSADTSIDISNYYLTDLISDTTKWIVPSGTIIDSNSFLIIWADDGIEGLHANFKLSQNGETLALFNNEKTLIDSVSFPNQKTDVSYGRNYENSNEWLYFAFPTPGKFNTTKGARVNKRSGGPIISHSSGFYTSGIELVLQVPTDSSRIFYTADGSNPTYNSDEYFAPITISSTTTFKIISVEENKIPSKIETRTFFVNEDIKLPVVSIVTDPQNFFDDEIGIYTIGTNGKFLWGVNANYWQDWERPAHIEFFENDKRLTLNMDIGIAINGARRNSLHKALRIFARSKYGDDKFRYKIFPDKPIYEFTSLVLRNGGYPDYQHTLFKDGFMQSLLINQMDVDYQSYRPSVLFVNGEYWGIYNIREKQNEDYLQSNHGVDPANVDMLEFDREVIEGSAANYDEMLDFIRNNDLSDDGNLDSLKTKMDLNEYVNYLISEIYYANLDWPANNMKYWRPNTPNGKWRWLVYDLEAGFGLVEGYSHNTLEHASAPNSPEWNNPPWSTFLFRELLKNKNFVNDFSQRFAAHLNFTFYPERVLEFIEKYQLLIAPQIPRHIEKWSNGCSPSDPQSLDGCTFSSQAEWLSQINVIKEFAEYRPQYVIQHLMEKFSISDTFHLTVNTLSETNGDVRINGVKAIYSQRALFFSNIPIKIIAVPKTGYKFIKWIGEFASSSPEISITMKKDISITPVFQKLSVNTIPNFISSNYTLSKNNIPYTLDGDLTIDKNATLFCEEGVEILLTQNANINVYGKLYFTGTKDGTSISVINKLTWVSSGF